MSSRSPGHQKWPDHRLTEQPISQRMRATLGGMTLAESTSVVRVDEEGYPPRYYFPRADVRMDRLERSQTHTHCPFKGSATYFSILGGAAALQDAAWSYEDPFEEHTGLKDLIAFWDDKIPAIEVRPVAAAD